MTSLKRCRTTEENYLPGNIPPSWSTTSSITNQNQADILNSRLGKCEVCAARNALYTCPKCEVKTCCLNCSKIHKKELECDGIRDRTKYIPLKKMTKMDFLNDYKFLEECTRYVANRKTDKIKRYTRSNKLLPTHLFKLRNAAFERQIYVKFLTENFTKHTLNTTYYNWKTKIIYWRIEWTFPNANNSSFIDERCSELELLANLLHKYLNIKNLEYYQSKGIGNLKILLKSEGIKKCKNRYYELDINQTLKTNLCNKTIVEFPCIYVVYDDCSTTAEQFDVIDSDEDVEMEAKNYRNLLEESYKKLLEIEENKKNDNTEIVDSNNTNANEKTEQVKELQTKQELEEKRKELKKQPRNLLFSDENAWDLSSTDSDSNDQADANNDNSLDPFFAM